MRYTLAVCAIYDILCSYTWCMIMYFRVRRPLFNTPHGRRKREENYMYDRNKWQEEAAAVSVDPHTCTGMRCTLAL